METRSSIETPPDAVKSAEKRPEPATKPPAVSDSVDQLAREQDKSDAARREAQAVAPQTLGEARSALGRLSMGTHARVVDLLFADDLDPFAEYNAIRASLTFGGRASTMSYSQLADALDEAQSICERASRLLANAKVTHDAFSIDAEVVRGTLRVLATDDLQAQKDAGTRSKAITDADIVSVMAKKFPDEYRALESQAGKARRMVDAIERLYERCVARAGDLRTLVAKTRES